MRQSINHGQECIVRVKEVISNYKELKEKGELEEKWIDAYLHASHFRDIPHQDLKAIFDACDQSRLKKISEQRYGHPIRSSSQNLNPFTVFRGCLGNEFRSGMSWTIDLYQAIKYPKRAKLHNFYGASEHQICSIWVALVEKDEIYCYLNHYEPEFIVCPEKYWKVDVPQELFEVKE